MVNKEANQFKKLSISNSVINTWEKPPTTICSFLFTQYNKNSHQLVIIANIFLHFTALVLLWSSEKLDMVGGWEHGKSNLIHNEMVDLEWCP